MQTVYVGNTLINDVMLGSQRMDDVFKGIISPLSIDWMMAAGGASGGTGNGIISGGGGGAGRFVSSSITIASGTSISVSTIGNGGTAQTSGTSNGNDGAQSQITILGTTYTAPGGGYGGAHGSGGGAFGDGGAGGSGGGGGATGNSGTTTTAGGAAEVGSPIAGFGNDGQSKGAASGNTPGGNGGGAGGVPTGIVWVNGTTYCVGGGGSGSTYGGGGGGSTYSGAAPSGAGQQGVVIIRYSGATKATGGTITQSGGYTYHTFTASGTFTY
jgi:hypothetical protein